MTLLYQNPGSITEIKLKQTTENFDLYTTFIHQGYQYLVSYKSEGVIVVDSHAAVGDMEPPITIVEPPIDCGEISRLPFTPQLVAIHGYTSNNIGYIFTYKGAHGAVYRFNGRGFENVWTRGWQYDWTNFGTYNLNNKSFAFAYKTTKGTLSIIHFLPNAMFKENIRVTIETGFSHVHAFHIANEPYILAYKSGEGEVYVYKIQEGEEPVVQWKEKWESGWTHFIVFYANEIPHLLAYKSNDGTTVAYVLSSHQSQEVFRNSWKANYNKMTFWDGVDIGNETGVKFLSTS
jgi:hypothetical protein